MIGLSLQVKCHDFKEKGPISCTYHGNPTNCHWYKDHESDYFHLLVDDLKKKVEAMPCAFCNSEDKLHVAHCEGVFYSPGL